jgi:hypothetical protein
MFGRLRYALAARPWRDGRAHPSVVHTDLIIGWYDYQIIPNMIGISENCYIQYCSKYIRLHYPHWYCWAKEYFVCFWCRLRGHPYNVIWFTNYDYEPDMRCKNCYEDLG